MKKWNPAKIETIEISETAFGLDNPNIPDSEKTQVEINGEKGWQQLYGENNSSLG